MKELELFDPKLVARKLGVESERSTLDETGLAPGDWKNSRTELYRSILRNPNPGDETPGAQMEREIAPVSSGLTPFQPFRVRTKRHSDRGAAGPATHRRRRSL